MITLWHTGQHFDLLTGKLTDMTPRPYRGVDDVIRGGSSASTVWTAAPGARDAETSLPSSTCSARILVDHKDAANSGREALCKTAGPEAKSAKTVRTPLHESCKTKWTAVLQHTPPEWERPRYRLWRPKC